MQDLGSSLGSDHDGYDHVSLVEQALARIIGIKQQQTLAEIRRLELDALYVNLIDATQQIISAWHTTRNLTDAVKSAEATVAAVRQARLECPNQEGATKP